MLYLHEAIKQSGPEVLAWLQNYLLSVITKSYRECKTIRGVYVSAVYAHRILIQGDTHLLRPVFKTYNRMRE